MLFAVLLILYGSRSNAVHGSLLRRERDSANESTPRDIAGSRAAPVHTSTQHSTAIREGIELLESAGVTGLCHPSTNVYAPELPHCGDTAGWPATAVVVSSILSTAGSSSSPSAKLPRPRQLEDNAEEDDEDNDAYFTSASDTLTDEDIEEIVKEYTRPDLTTLVLSTVGAAICVITAGLASGLTYGILSLDPIMLLIKQRTGATQRERRQAGSLLLLVQQRHFLIVTLLLLSCSASEALPVFLNVMVPEVVAVVISVAAVLVLGDIVPSAVFTGSNQIALACSFAPLVKLFMCLLYPIAWPISLLLDTVFAKGENESAEGLNRVELAALIRIQYEQKMAKTGGKHHVMHPSLLEDVLSSFFSKRGDDIVTSDDDSVDKRSQGHTRTKSIHIDEVNIAEGALQMSTRFAVDIFLSLGKVYSIPIDTVLTEDKIVSIYTNGYSRVPVYEGGDKSRIKGILMTRQLIVVNKNDKLPVSRLPLYMPQCVGPDTNLVDLINLFQTGGHSSRVGHMALVCAKPEIGNAALEENDAVPVEAGLMG